MEWHHTDDRSCNRILNRADPAYRGFYNEYVPGIGFYPPG
jgi:hypothetical protein